jgi:hypothetical protein
MPLIDVSFVPLVPDATLRALAELLPDIVSRAVECPEEPYVPPLQPGDVEIRFRERGPLDVVGLPVVIEVHSKWFESRARDRQERADRIHAEVAAQTELTDFGVYLRLPVAAWAQGE